uniref:Golgi associated RAB2 interactor protein-like Rab2B-binding domain-containing protein n=1 Tax=Naja naja TaxID=35670 RepID=A0A8C7DSH6_NAJNA
CFPHCPFLISHDLSLFIDSINLLNTPSDFRAPLSFLSIQVNKDGQFINIHKHPNVVTIGILASSPRLLLPDLMIILPRPPCKVRVLVLLFLTYRLIPLDLVEISVHDANKRQLKMHLPTGDKHYLQLLAKEEKVDFLFECWVHLIYLMRLASGKSKTPENLPGKKPEVHTLWKSSPLQAKVTELADGRRAHIRSGSVPGDF